VSDLFGFFLSTLLALGAVAALFRVGVNDGDRFGDARVDIRLIRTAAEGALFAEVVIDNQNDSPVVVSARARAASLAAVVMLDAQTRRTALRHRDCLDDDELLGAVEGRARCRFLLPLAATAGTRALRVTAIVDQVGGRTRLVTATVVVARAESDAAPARRGLVPGR
jgi:hypothetical protein